jgi:hypothetical protein
VIDADASNVDKLGQVVFVWPASRKGQNCGRKSQSGGENKTYT